MVYKGETCLKKLIMILFFSVMITVFGYGSAFADTNIALHKTVTGNLTVDSNYDSSIVTDGVINVGYIGGTSVISGSTPDTVSYVTVDLGSINNISDVKASLNAPNTQWNEKADIYFSTDNITFTKYGYVRHAAYPTEVALATKEFSGTVVARYIKVTNFVKGIGNYTRSTINELEVYGPSAPLPPSAPTNLTATAGNAQITLTWPAVTGATGYNIKRSTTTGGPYTAVASNVTGSPYTDTAVTNGTTYYYVITAVNATGESANSAQVSATPQAPLPAAPTAPTLTGQSGNSQNTLTWTASSGATSYEVKRSTMATGPYTTITSSVYSNVYSTYTDTSVVNGTTYYYVVSASNTGGSSSNSNEISLTPQALEPTLNIVIAEEKVKVGQEFTANVELKNVTNIYAEDFTVKYDKTLFDYLGFETVTGHQVYNQPTDQNGNLRFIVASQGVNYGITGEKTFVKLKLRAKAVGVGKVDANKCRIADTASEFDLGEPSCGEDTVTVENMDVNRTGQYTLLDLAIDGYYYGQLASNANPAVYTADQAGDEYVNNDDLVFIVNQMLLNTNYTPNY
jgi:fibronectin type 3 domain-containing protein